MTGGRWEVTGGRWAVGGRRLEVASGWWEVILNSVRGGKFNLRNPSSSCAAATGSSRPGIPKTKAFFWP